MPSKYFENIVSCHLTSVNWLLKHRLYKNRQPVTEDEVSDEESSTHSPHQPQQVEGVKTIGMLLDGKIHPDGKKRINIKANMG